MRRIVAIALGGLFGAALILVVAGWGFIHTLDLDALPAPAVHATVADLDFVPAERSARRGRILAVVTSTARIGSSGRKAGYELTELARAYWVFVANGYAVDIASPRGGEPPMVKDDDLVAADYAFLNDAEAMAKVAHTLPLAEVDAGRYDAVYFVGGKGAMFDFVGHADIQRIVRDIAPRGVIGAVCHGPAALVGVTLDDGQPLLRGRQATGFSNAEELFLIENARELFPFLLQEKMAAEGARFVEGAMYLDNTVVDGRLVTGQNPWSTWTVAEAMVRALGHEPVARATTAEEQSVRLLATYRRHGLDAALAETSARPGRDRMLLLMHAAIAAMQWRLGEAYELQRLARP